MPSLPPQEDTRTQSLAPCNTREDTATAWRTGREPSMLEDCQQLKHEIVNKCLQEGFGKSSCLSVDKQLEGMALYTGQLLAPVGAFGLRPRILLPLGLQATKGLIYNFCPFLVFSNNLSNF